MELKKQDTIMLQGLFVLAMVWLHLFDCGYQGVFTPLLFVQGVPLTYYLGQLSDCCVFGFAFCSGYAHMAQYGEKGFYSRRLKGLLTLFVGYWLILIVFCAISALMGQANNMPGSLIKFVRNALAIENSYNGAWWYMLAYAILVFTSPLIMKAVKKWHPIIVLGIGFAIYCAAYYVRFADNLNIEPGNWLLLKFGPVGMTLFEYIIGAVCYRLRIFTKMYCFWKKPGKTVRFLIAVMLIAAMLYVRTKVVPSLFIAPITGFVIMTLFHYWEKPACIKSVFSFVGKHSTNIWLTHMFFYMMPFQGLVYKARYPLLIYAFMLAITLLLSLILQYIAAPLQRRIAAI